MCPKMKTNQQKGGGSTIEEKISKFMNKQAAEQRLAKRKEKIQVCIKTDSYIGREILYQTALLHEILEELRKKQR